MEKIFSAKTLDEAKSLALAFFGEQGVPEYEVDISIIEQPVKKLFGSKGEYRIRATAPDSAAVAAAPAVSESAAVVSKAKPQEKEIAAGQIAAQVPDSAESPDSPESAVAAAVTYLTRVLNALGAKSFTIKVTKSGGAPTLDIVGDKLGIAIGRRGETLDALQYLTILAAGRGESHAERFRRLVVDCNGYRAKRRESLEILAVRTAEKVLAQGRRITLEPMNPYERRIIHSKVSEVAGVSSGSIGEDPYRKVVISADVPRRSGSAPVSTTAAPVSGTAPAKPEYRNNRDSRDNRDNRNRGDNRGNRDNNRNSRDRAGEIRPTGTYKRESNDISTSFEREFRKSRDRDIVPVEISKETTELEKNALLFGKIEL